MVGYILFFVFFGLVLAALWMFKTNPRVGNIMMWSAMALAGIITFGLFIWLFLTNM